MAARAGGPDSDPERHGRERAAALPDDRPSALIYHKRLLSWSETFIASQGLALERYRPVFVAYAFREGGKKYLEGADCVVLSEHAAFPTLSKGAVRGLGIVTPRWRRALESRKPALVHAHFGINTSAAFAIARTLELPLLVTFHGMDITAERDSWRGRRERERIFREASRVIGVSEFIAGRLREAGCPEEKLVVHYIGVDTDLFSPGGEPDHGPPGRGARGEARILFAGRLVPKKGLVHLLRAMRAVEEARPAAEVVVAGDGPLRGGLEEEAADLGVSVRFLGVRTPEELRELMRGATVFCAPYVVAPDGDAEGLGLTIVEAQACGLPVVAYPSGGSPESIVHGKTGFVVPPRDEEALARRLLQLLDDPERRARFSRAARGHVLENFDLRRQTRKLEEIYDEVVRAR